MKSLLTTHDHLLLIPQSRPYWVFSPIVGFHAHSTTLVPYALEMRPASPPPWQSDRRTNQHEPTSVPQIAGIIVTPTTSRLPDHYAR